MIGSFDKTNLEELPEGMNLVEQGHILGDWFIFRESRHFGPLSSQQVRGYLTSSLLSTDHYIWRPGFNGWKPINEIEGFKSYGSASIDVYSDEEFSYKGKLNHIDRIGKEVSALDFSEGEKPMTRAEVEASIRDKEKALTGFNLGTIKRYFGIDTGYLNFGRIMSSLIIVAVIGAVVFKNIQNQDMNALHGLSKEVSKVLLEASAGSDNIRNPIFKAFEKAEGAPDPILVFGTDLPVGVHLIIDVTGITGTLVGAYRFNQMSKLEMKEKIFKTDPIRQASGKFIPPGIYSVKVTCVDCLEKNKLVYDKTHEFGIKDKVLYQRNLSSYQAETRENIGLELDELDDLSFAIFSQYKDSANMFMDFSKRKNPNGWHKFSADWLVKQKKLIDLFSEVKTEKFQSSVYFIDFYKAFEKVVTKVFELHLLQDSTLMTGRGLGRNSKKMDELVKEANEDLSSIKAKLQISRIDFNRNKGLPKIPDLDI